MSSEPFSLHTFLEKNKVKILGIGICLIAIFCILYFVYKKKPTPGITPAKIKENFSFSSFSNDDTFELYNVGNVGNYNVGNYEENEIVENYGQENPMNVMYSDANGNLATTTDLGLTNMRINKDGALFIGNKFRFNANKDAWFDDDWLRMMNNENTGYGGGIAAKKLYAATTVISDGNVSARGNIDVSGDVVFTGLNKWIIHTPDDTRRSMSIAPMKDPMPLDANGNPIWDWNWDAQTLFTNTGDINVSGTLSSKSLSSRGDLSAGGTLSIPNYPNVKSTLDTILAKISELEGRVGGNDSSIASLSTRAGNLETNLASRFPDNDSVKIGNWTLKNAGGELWVWNGSWNGGNYNAFRASDGALWKHY